MSVAQHIEIPRLTAPSNGDNAKEKMHDSLHGKHLPKQLPPWLWLRTYLKKGFAHVVTKSEQGRYTISQPLAICILGAVLIAGVGAYWRSQDQHDQIIRLETTIELLEKTNADRDSKIDQAANWGQSAKSDVKYLQGKFDQFALDYVVKEKRPQTQE